VNYTVSSKWLFDGSIYRPGKSELGGSFSWLTQKDSPFWGCILVYPSLDRNSTWDAWLCFSMTRTRNRSEKNFSILHTGPVLNKLNNKINLNKPFIYILQGLESGLMSEVFVLGVIGIVKHKWTYTDMGPIGLISPGISISAPILRLYPKMTTPTRIACKIYFYLRNRSQNRFSFSLNFTESIFCSFLYSGQLGVFPSLSL